MSRTIRVAITGAQGSGKSTFAKALCRRFYDQFGLWPELLTNISDDVFATGIPMGLSCTTETISAFTDAHLRRERKASGRLTIFDRCMLDTLAYAELSDCLITAKMEHLRAVTAKSMSEMDLVFLLGVGGDYPVITAADEDLATRTRIDRMIRNSAATLGIAVTDIDTTDSWHIEAGLVAITKVLG